MNLRYHKNRPFLIVNTVHRPAKAVRTEHKGWGNMPGNWDSLESVAVVDRVSDKNRRSATVIIDLLQKTLIHNRYSESPAADVLKHYLDKYAGQSNEAMGIWLARQAIATASSSSLPFAVSSTSAVGSTQNQPDNDFDFNK